MNAEEGLATHIKERDEILLSGDIDRMMEFLVRNGLPPLSSREFAEVVMHKARTAVCSLPREVRIASKQWLSERGYHSLDDGDMNDA